MAALLDRMPRPTFRIIETDAGEFRWRLHDDGTVLATSGDAYPTRQAATRRIQRLKRVLPEAGIAAADSP